MGSGRTLPDPGDGNIIPDPVASSRPARRRKGQRLTLVLIDPAPLTREALSQMLSEYIIVAASSWDELLQMQEGPPTSPALVFINIKSAELTDSWVKSTLDLIRHDLADAAVVLLSDRDSADQVANALALGVRGYITTSMEAEVAFAALRLIHAGGTFVPAHALSAATANPTNGSNCGQNALVPGLDLTAREFSVIGLLCEGKPNKVIATALELQESTVKVHVRNIMRKLHVTNRTHAVTVVNRLVADLELIPAPRFVA
ncbi:MAG: response regulator transcription factor [Stellaceae bacterium]